MPSGKQSKRRRREQAQQAPPPVGKRQSLLAEMSPRAWALVGGGVAVVIVGMVLAVVLSGGGSKAPRAIPEDKLTGLISEQGPWGANADTLSYRLDEIRLPALGQEGSELHIHQHLDLFVNGRRFEVPGGIGIDPQGKFISPLHVHDTSGVLHVESPTNETYTLGQMFAVWGVKLTSKCLGGYCNEPLRAYVNGKARSGSLASLELTPHEEIAVVVGKPPTKVPSSYKFEAGE